ncbi:MAG TPA: SDR family NAD(P)-dependent oxidoreductase [Gaiellaceae bacterium]|nr:SDR family NAD(P)-dependent oxidoreductase [Gaiellaceae bacterium]
MSRLDGTRALVTGATGGLGTAVAGAFVDEGARVALVARNPAKLESLQARLGDATVSVAADVSVAGEAARAVDEAIAAFGGLDAVVNAAAIDTVWRPVGELPVEEWDHAIAVNLSGTFYVCRSALPHLVERGGAIVNLTSVAGLRAWEEDAAYNASKAGVELLTRTISVEYGSRGVRANCLAPGVIDAGMTDVITDPKEREALARKHPLGRLGLAEEVAEAAVWLASDASSFTTGTTLTVDGGFLA